MDRRAASHRQPAPSSPSAAAIAAAGRGAVGPVLRRALDARRQRGQLRRPESLLRLRSSAVRAGAARRPSLSLSSPRHEQDRHTRALGFVQRGRLAPRAAAPSPAPPPAWSPSAPRRESPRRTAGNSSSSSGKSEREEQSSNRLCGIQSPTRLAFFSDHAVIAGRTNFATTVVASQSGERASQGGSAPRAAAPALGVPWSSSAS